MHLRDRDRRSQIARTWRRILRRVCPRRSPKLAIEFWFSGRNGCLSCYRAGTKVEVRGAAYKSGSYYLGHAFFCVVIRCNDGWPAAPGCWTGARLAMCLSPAVVRCVRVCFLIRQAPEV